MKNKVIIALDVSSRDKALHLVKDLHDSAGMFKVGNQLFTAGGPQIVRDIVAVLNRICAGVNRSLYAGSVNCVDSDFQVLAVGFVDHGREFRQRDVISGSNLYYVDILKNILSNCLAGPIRPIYRQKFLLQDGVCKRGIETLDI